MQEVQTHLIVSSPEKQEYKNISPPIYYILLKDAFQTRTYWRFFKVSWANHVLYKQNHGGEKEKYLSSDDPAQEEEEEGEEDIFYITWKRQIVTFMLGISSMQKKPQKTGNYKIKEIKYINIKNDLKNINMISIFRHIF